MEEDKDDAQWTDVPYSKEIDGEQALAVRAPISKLVVSNLTRNIPAYKQASEHGASRQHEVGRQLVAEVHH